MTERALLPSSGPSDDGPSEPYRLAILSDETVSRWTERVLTTELGIVAEAAGGGFENDVAIHRSRQALKRSRAVLRLIRRSGKDASYRHHNVVMRDIGRKISSVRSATVHRTVAASLAEDDPAMLPELTWRRVHVGLEDHHQRLRHAVTADVSSTQGIVADTSDLRTRIGELGPLAEPSTVMSNLGTLYVRGQRQMAKAAATDVVGDFHRWRKNVKYLRHAVEALTGLDRSAVPLAEQLAEVGRMLGAANDLADLESVVDELELVPEPALRTAFREAVAAHRKKFEANALDLGEGVYPDAPEVFTARFEPTVAAWVLLPKA